MALNNAALDAHCSPNKTQFITFRGITHRFCIPASDHLYPLLIHKILKLALIALRFCSIGLTKSDLNQGANSNDLSISSP